jgi:uncharacterized protein YegP (UPF0339 family)
MSIIIFEGRPEAFKSKINGQWYGRVKGQNGQIVWQTEGYKRKRSVNRAFEIIGIDPDSVPVVDA